MSQSGYTPIQLYYSTTASNTPSTSNLKLGELAFNIADNKIYALNTASNAIQTVVGTLGNQNKTAVSITGGAIDGTTIGATTASTGAFTTLSASSTVSGTGFSNYLASPPAIGGTAANTITGTTITANTQFDGAGTGLTGTASSLSIGGAAPAGSLSGTTLNSTVVSSSLTSVGTLTTGTWNATTIAVAHGGTGLTSLTSGYIPYGNGTSALSSTSNLSFDGTNLSVAGVVTSTGIYQTRSYFSGSGGNTYTFTTLSNVSSNQSYLITVRQSGSASNNVLGVIYAYGSSAKAYNVVQDNTNSALLMTLGSSGLGITLTLGSGFGTTTWDWVLTRLG